MVVGLGVLRARGVPVGRRERCVAVGGDLGGRPVTYFVSPDERQRNHRSATVMRFGVKSQPELLRVIRDAQDGTSE